MQAENHQTKRKGTPPCMREQENMKKGNRRNRFIKLYEKVNPWIIQKKIAQYSGETAILLNQRAQ